MSELRCGTCGELEYPKWISVKDRLPDYHMYVLFYPMTVVRWRDTKIGDPPYCFVSNYLHHNNDHQPAHWMPLPEPHK